MSDDPNEITLREAAQILKRAAADPNDPAIGRPDTEAGAALEAMLSASRRGKTVKSNRKAER
jgi:hypothetical protein